MDCVLTVIVTCVCLCVSEGQIDETVQCLETLADISRSSGLQDKLADTCLCQGNIYYTRVSAHTRLYKYICLVEL